MRSDQGLYRYLRSFFDTRCVVLKDKKGLRGPNGVCSVTPRLVPARSIYIATLADTKAPSTGAWYICQVHRAAQALAPEPRVPVYM